MVASTIKTRVDMAEMIVALAAVLSNHAAQVEVGGRLVYQWSRGKKRQCLCQRSTKDDKGERKFDFRRKNEGANVRGGIITVKNTSSQRRGTQHSEGHKQSGGEVENRGRVNVVAMIPCEVSGRHGRSMQS
ncbi:unnamed protein product [Linum trigynum]|uniref:Secreted protein n=1 Tax=Linum trigynum TaxID=586398 RepID=A0AAV2G5R9_9ROSI